MHYDVTRELPFKQNTAVPVFGYSRETRGAHAEMLLSGWRSRGQTRTPQTRVAQRVPSGQMSYLYKTVRLSAAALDRRDPSQGIRLRRSYERFSLLTGQCVGEIVCPQWAENTNPATVKEQDTLLRGKHHSKMLPKNLCRLQKIKYRISVVVREMLGN